MQNVLKCATDQNTHAIIFFYNVNTCVNIFKCMLTRYQCSYCVSNALYVCVYLSTNNCMAKHVGMECGVCVLDCWCLYEISQSQACQLMLNKCSFVN